MWHIEPCGPRYKTLSMLLSSRLACVKIIFKKFFSMLCYVKIIFIKGNLLQSNIFMKVHYKIGHLLLLAHPRKLYLWIQVV